MLIGREEEQRILENWLFSGRNVIFIEGSAGMGKTALISFLTKIVQDNDFYCLKGSAHELNKPFQIFYDMLAGYEIDFGTENFTQFSELFVIDNSGLLVARVTAAEKTMVDQDILSGMLTAVQEFVKDAFRRGEAETETEVEEEGGLNRLEYKDMKILLAHGKRVYIAAVVRGDEHPDMKDDVNRLVLTIEDKYGGIIDSFASDLATTKPIVEYLQGTITKKYPIVEETLDEKHVNSMRAAVFEKVTKFFQSLSSQKRTVVILEDIHNCDENSLMLFQYLAKSLKNAPVQFCCTYRPESLTESVNRLLDVFEDCERLVLQPLSAEVIKDFLNCLPCAVEDLDGFATLTYTYTKGNPFWVEQFLQALVEDVQIRGLDKLQLGEFLQFDITSSIADLVLSRLKYANEEELKAIEYAAVSGGFFNINLLSYCLGVGEERTVQLVSKLCEKKFLESVGDNFQIPTTVIADIVYKNINKIWLPILHKKVAITLERLYEKNIDEVVYELARHYSNTFEFTNAIKYNMLAAEKARSLLGIEAAHAYYRKALEFANLLPTIAKRMKAKLFENCGDCNALLGNYETAVKDFECAKELCESQMKIAALCRKIATMQIRAGKYENALAAVSAGFKYVDEKQDTEYGRLCLTAADIYTRLNRFDTAIDFCNRAYTNFMKNKTDEKDFAKFYHTKGNVYLSENAYEDAYNAYEKSLELFDEMKDLYGATAVLNNIGLIHKNKGNYEKALLFYNRVVKISAKVNDLYSVATAYNNIGFVKYRLEDYDGALEACLDCLELCEKIGFVQIAAAACENISRIYEAKGEFENAIKYLDKSRAARLRLGESKAFPTDVFV